MDGLSGCLPIWLGSINKFLKYLETGNSTLVAQNRARLIASNNLEVAVRSTETVRSSFFIKLTVIA